MSTIPLHEKLLHGLCHCLDFGLILGLQSLAYPGAQPVHYKTRKQSSTVKQGT